MVATALMPVSTLSLAVTVGGLKMPATALAPVAVPSLGVKVVALKNGKDK